MEPLIAALAGIVLPVAPPWNLPALDPDTPILRVTADGQLDGATGPGDGPVVLAIDQRASATRIAEIYATLPTDRRVCALVQVPNRVAMICNQLDPAHESETWFVGPDDTWGEIGGLVHGYRVGILPAWIELAGPPEPATLILDRYDVPGTSVEVYPLRRLDWPDGARGEARCAIEVVVGPSGAGSRSGEVRSVEIRGCPAPFVAAVRSQVSELAWQAPHHGLTVLTAPVRFEAVFEHHHRAVGWDFRQVGTGMVSDAEEPCASFTSYVQDGVTLTHRWVAARPR